jgi:hypothetical protein
MTPEERKAFWARMSEGKAQSNARHWDPAAFGLKPFTHAKKVQQDGAKLSVFEYPINYDLLNLTKDDLAFLADLKVGV